MGRALLVLAVAAAGATATCGEPSTSRESPECGASAAVRVLVFTKTAGFRHESIAAGTAAMCGLGEEDGFAVEPTEDAAAFTDLNLARFDAVVFLNTTGDVLDADQEAAFERYVRAGGGFAGVHSASDTEPGWPWYRDLVGARFVSHPAVQQVTVQVVVDTHPSTRGLPAAWTRTDEWYDFDARPSAPVQVLATVDEGTYEGGIMGARHPIAWYHGFEGGRSWYTGMGHTRESYAEPDFLTHLRGGVLWAAGLAPDTVAGLVASRDTGENERTGVEKGEERRTR
jgi:type 1 glutamine amidotransferase